MKKIGLLLAAFLFLMNGMSQNQPPVAVDDTATSRMGEFVTVPVLLNDYDPDGDDIKIKVANGSYSFTDSTITYFFDFAQYGGFSGTLDFTYVIEDEHGLFGYESFGKVFIFVENEVSKHLDINNINARFYAYGNHFSDHYLGNTYEYPAGSGLHTMFNSVLWVGGKDGQNQLRLAGERYRQIGTDYWPGPLSTDGNAAIDSATSLDWSKIWKLDKQQVLYHKLHWNDPGYEMPEAIATWPAHGDPELNQSPYLAPFVDVNNDSVYSPHLGDYPLIRGDQTLFFIFNDQKPHTETGGQPIGIEIHGMAYGFDAPEGTPLHNSVFLSYKLFNRSLTTLTDTYAGIFSDFDIGYAYDDFVGCDVGRGAFYGYNGEEEDPEYGLHPPAQGIVVLGGPYLDPDGLDNPAGGCDESINGVGFGDGIADNERYGMRKFVYFDNTAGVTGDPIVADEYYNYMKGLWRDNTPLLYGGSGHHSTGAYGPECDFSFPGLSDPCNWGTGGIPPNGPVDWAEQTAGNTPSDRRGLCVMGPFTLEPNGFHKIDIAFVTAPGDEINHSIITLLNWIDSVKTFYYLDPDHFGYGYLGMRKNKSSNTLKIYPNPVGEQINLSGYPELEGCEYNIYGVTGSLLITGRIRCSEGIPTERLGSGLYILTIKTKQGALVAKFIR